MLKRPEHDHRGGLTCSDMLVVLAMLFTAWVGLVLFIINGEMP